jgi:hypothetical protein
VADEGGVLVVEFARDAFGARLGGDEFYFADQFPTPCFIDARAEFRLHIFELLAPGFIFGGDFEGAFLTAQRTSASGESFADDLGPRADEPGEGGFGSVKAAESTAENLSGLVHRVCGF